VKERRSTARVWRAPALLAVLTVVGMFAALPEGSHAGTVLSWIALAVPVMLCLRALRPEEIRPERGGKDECQAP